MSIEFRCSGCNKLLRVPDASEGQQARCPECGQISQVSVAPLQAEQTSPFADTMAPVSSDGYGFGVPNLSASTVENPYAPPASIEPLTSPASRHYLGFPLASRWKRFVGSILDGLIHVGGVVPGFVAIIVMGDGANDVAAMVAMIAMLCGLAVVVIYNCVLITRTGQSIAKQILGMRIVTTDGQLPGFVMGVLVRHWAPAIINQFCNVFTLVDALVIFGEPRRCIHDYMASTIVVDVTLD